MLKAICLILLAAWHSGGCGRKGRGALDNPYDSTYTPLITVAGVALRADIKIEVVKIRAI